MRTTGCLVLLAVGLLGSASAAELPYPSRPLRKEIAKWARVIKAAGIKPQ